MKALEIKTDLLKLEGEGFPQSEIVKYLSQKYQVTERNVYYHFRTRDTWQPILLEFKDKDRIANKITNRYEQIYRKAGFLLQQTTSDNAKAGFLRVMLDSNTHLAEVLLLPELNSRIEVLEKQAETEVKKPWR